MRCFQFFFFLCVWKAIVELECISNTFKINFWCSAYIINWYIKSISEIMGGWWPKKPILGPEGTWFWEQVKNPLYQQKPGYKQHLIKNEGKRSVDCWYLFFSLMISGLDFLSTKVGSSISSSGETVSWLKVFGRATTAQFILGCAYA